MLAVYGVVLGGHGKLGKAHQHPPVGHAHNVSVHYIHVLYGLPRYLAGVFQYLFAEQVACLAYGEARNVGLAGGVGAEAGGGYVGILAAHHVYVPVAFQPYHLGGHLGVGGVRALAYLRLAALHGDGAVKVELHAVGAGLEGYGVYGGVVPEGGKANAPANGAGILCVFLNLSAVVYGLRALFKAHAEGIVVVLVLGEAVHKALGHYYLVPVIHGIHAQCPCALIYVGIVCEGCLGHAVAPHCARRRAVGEYGVCVALEVIAGIYLRE